MRNPAATRAKSDALPTEVLLRALPWLAALAAASPLVFAGFPRGHDWSFELLRVAEYRAAAAAGQWPPYWGENLYMGYGSPVFLYYAPLFSALAAGASAWASSIASGAAAVLALATLASVPFVRAFLAGLLEAAGLRDAGAVRLGTTLWLLDPYLLGDKLVRNADAEYLALCLVPIALAGVARAGREPRRAFFLVSSGIALTAVAHNLTALVAAAFALGLAAVLWSRGPRAAWAVVLGGVAAGLALAAFFWLPALSLEGLIRPEELLRGKFDYRHEFPPVGQLFGWVRFFSIGLAAPAVWLAALAAVARFPAQRRVLVALLAVVAWLLFLETEASAAVWAAVPGLPLFQFPWRMMGPLALVSSALVALAAALFSVRRPPELRALAEAGAAGLLLANALPRLLAYQPLPPELRTQLPQALSPAAVRETPISVTVGDEYLPRAADPDVWKRDRPIAGPVAGASGPVRWETLADGGSRIELATHADAPARLRLARFAFPEWHIEVNGSAVEPAPSTRGVLEIDVPAGEARVVARLEPPRVRRAALWLSAAALAAWLAAWLVTGRRRAASIASRG
ncbi:MAG TPA: hypothetical protein VMR31_00750 [Myxococcota bacterium]|nr:hypothetical protein [Myxococcota bacterium]